MNQQHVFSAAKSVSALRRCGVAALAAATLIALGACEKKKSNVSLRVVPNVAVVLPNKLTSGSGTCVSEDVSGPRVRLGDVRLTYKVDDASSNRIFLPLLLQLSTENSAQLSGDIKQTLGTSDNADSTIAFLWNQNPSYSSVTGCSGAVTSPEGNGICPSDQELSMILESGVVGIQCYADFGSLPEPKNYNTLRGELKITATLRVFGIEQDRGTGNDPRPVTGQAKVQLTYFPGSVPVQ